MADTFSINDSSNKSLAKDVASPVTVPGLTPNTVYSGWTATKNDGTDTLTVPDQTTLPSKPTITLTAGEKSFTANVALATGDGSASIKQVLLSYQTGSNAALSQTFDNPTDLTKLAVTGLADATAYSVTAQVTNASGDSAASDAVSVTTTTPVVAATGVTADASLSVAVGATVKIKAVVAPDNATDKAVTYTSADETLATVAADGTVTGVKATTADTPVNITVALKSDSTKTAVVPVTVTAAA